MPIAGTAPIVDFSSLSVAVFPPLRVATEASAISSTSAIVTDPMVVVWGVLPPKAVMGFKLCTLAAPLWIDEVRANDFHFGFHFGQRTDQPHLFALAVAAVFEEPKRDVMAQNG